MLFSTAMPLGACSHRCLLLIAVSAIFRYGNAESSIGLSLMQVRAKIRSGAPTDQAVVQTLRTLDSNRDGRVTPDEVKAFALKRGLDPEEVASEFADLDTSGDGTLDSSEISLALASASTSASTVATSASSHRVTEDEADKIHKVVEKRHGERHGRTVSRRRHSSSSDSDSSSSTTRRRRRHSNSSSSSLSPASLTRSAAEVAATSLVDSLADEELAEREAMQYELNAAELRANSTALAEQAAQTAREAGQLAAVEKAHAILRDLALLESAARAAEEEAAELRADSQADLLQAQNLMAIADEALQAQEVTALIADDG